MTVFKFQDLTDGNFAFVVSETRKAAVIKLKQKTNFTFKLISKKPLFELEGTWIIYNDILPF